MLSRRLLMASCLIVALMAITTSAQPLKPKDGPLGMKFVPLPKATFYMGWDGAKKGVTTEIKEEFEIAVHTVTQEQWQAVMGNNPSYFSRDGGNKDKVKDSRLDLAAGPYGVFLAGPSATGDIEGVIVHGAQGARCLTVLFLAPAAQKDEG